MEEVPLTEGKADKPSSYVRHSTAASVEGGTFSILAAGEVVIAVMLYCLVSVWFSTQVYLWVSIAVAPLLLLRSEASVALGVRWFEHYVDQGFRQNPERAIRSVRLWIAALAAAIVVPGAAELLAHVLLFGPVSVASVILGFVVGYLVAQVNMAIILAIAANELAMLLEWKSIVLGIAALEVVAASVGVARSGVEALPAAAVVLASIGLAIIGVRGAPSVNRAIVRAEASAHEESQGVAGVQDLFEIIPYSFAAFCPGALIGGWLRSVAIRFAATFCHLLAGLLILPFNWYRTLFVIDFTYPPEIVPGYRRPDILQTSYLIGEIKRANNPLKLFVYLTAFIVMFLPAYFYRITIKSTCWFYVPIIYIVRTRRLAGNPALLADLVWNSPFEWGRRLLAAMILAALFARQAVSSYARGVLPTEVVSPLEYVFLIDISVIKPWQWFNLTSAFLTTLIFMCGGTFRIFVRHARRDQSIASFVAWRASFLEYAMRLRNLSTVLFLFIAFLHVLLWKIPDYLPPYIFGVLRKVFG